MAHAAAKISTMLFMEDPANVLLSAVAGVAVGHAISDTRISTTLFLDKGDAVAPYSQTNLAIEIGAGIDYNEDDKTFTMHYIADSLEEAHQVVDGFSEFSELTAKNNLTGMIRVSAGVGVGIYNRGEDVGLDVDSLTDLAICSTLLNAADMNLGTIFTGAKGKGIYVDEDALKISITFTYEKHIPSATTSLIEEEKFTDGFAEEFLKSAMSDELFGARNQTEDVLADILGRENVTAIGHNTDFDEARAAKSSVAQSFVMNYLMHNYQERAEDSFIAITGHSAWMDDMLAQAEKNK